MTKLLFDAPLNKKLTESEAVIAALIVEKTSYRGCTRKLPMPQALNACNAVFKVPVQFLSHVH